VSSLFLRGNAAGGRRGVIVGAFANGTLNSFLLPVLGLIGVEGTMFGEWDFDRGDLIKLFS
jgi:ascorbate PTS system EIIC component